MIRTPGKLPVTVFIVLIMSVIFFQSGSAGGSIPEAKTLGVIGAPNMKFAQIGTDPINCTFTTGPLTAGISSTNFPYGDLYKTGSSYICHGMGAGAGTGIGDFNNDGRNDIVMTWHDAANGFNYNVSIAYQDAQGNLSTSPTVYWVGNLSMTLAVGDLNHDGLDDFATADRFFDGKINVFIQQANGTMIKTPYPAVYGPDAIAIGDINNDGLDDAAVSSWGQEPNSIGVFIQNQDGTLNVMVTYPSINAGYDDIAIGDVNNDGLNDVVKLNGQGTLSDLLVYLQNSNGQLNDYVSYSLGPLTTYRGANLAIGDVTGDGLSDIVVSYSPDWTYSHMAVFAQDANGILLPPVSYLTWSGQTQVRIADVNDDGRQDIVTAHTGWQNIGVFLQLPNGTLATETLYRANYSDVAGISVGDLNNDALTDIFVADTAGFDVLYREPIFSDLLLNYWAGSFINRLYRASITGGCSLSPLMYCPEVDVNRAQMAVFLLRGEHGSAYAPPSVGSGTGFTDVPADYWAAAWIKQLALEGITSGCGPSLYCPETSVTRDQMAVFLLRAEHGASYSPPPATGVFTDVPTTHWAAPWIEQLAIEGITGGCGVDTYCPSTPVTRAQMAVFLVRTFNLP